jgi:hypothetical protein
MSALVDCRQMHSLVHRRVASRKSPAPQYVVGAMLTDILALIDVRAKSAKHPTVYKMRNSD